jgi:hypothetical protein
MDIRDITTGGKAPDIWKQSVRKTFRYPELRNIKTRTWALTAKTAASVL